MKNISKENIIIFDGECRLCNGVVTNILRFSPDKNFRFVAFQSWEGKTLLKANNFAVERLETVILIDEQGVHTHSDGFLKILSKIPKFQKVARLMTLVPKIIRDFIYTTAAKKRVQWFGKSKTCTIVFSSVQAN
ncbi:thiol-disulfide oxidoreductase DCC family protein [Spongiimicrobium sp. 3-5]|uniref:thiol-disulfide oxidoreductase DCC family protein n=1 Tax=Spongiimicrobium sp. 3-5 TaxID=3332596 RepID=UPI00398114FA